jgi:hypothetical protein
MSDTLKLEPLNEDKCKNGEGFSLRILLGITKERTILIENELRKCNDIVSAIKRATKISKTANEYGFAMFLIGYVAEQ